MAQERLGCPVVEDFDYVTTTGATEHMAIFDTLRNQHPAFYSTFGRGFHVFTSAELQRDALQNPGVFSSTANNVQMPDQVIQLIPVTMDPPRHTVWRHLLSPHFSPAAVEALEPRVRERCIQIIDGLATKGTCDFIADFGREFPTTIFMGLMGLPLDDAQRFMAWEDKILHRTNETDPDASEMLKAQTEVMAYFTDLVEKRRVEPADDLVSAALTWTIDGQKIPADDVLSMCLLMFMAGLDTVTAQLGYSFLHLATHPEDRRRIVDDPAIIPMAVEEFLRYYAIVSPVRKVVDQVDFHGFTLMPDDMVALPLCAAARDPHEFEDAHLVDFDRPANRHTAFGAGPHRCLGSHLARRELRIAFEEWHKRIPEYQLAPDTSTDDLHEVTSGVLSFDRLPLVWAASPQTG
jgi:cytochrome P450